MFTHPDLSLFHPLDWPDTALTFCRLRDFTCPLLAIIRVFRIADSACICLRVDSDENEKLFVIQVYK
jgi:hypothetical protein